MTSPWPGALVTAPAKLTLSLRVTGVRADGYHLIAAEMVTLDLADEVWIDPAGDGLRVTGPYAAGVPDSGDNLISRALGLLGRRAGVTLVKNIPHGGGLGGGSADAAAVLRWGGITDPRTAVRIGADVGFCLVGGRAMVGGIGEEVDPLPPTEETVTLVLPPFGVSTPAVYRAWDALGGPRAAGPNDLELAAVAVEPRLADWRARIRAACGTDPVLAGSGSTWFLRGDHLEALMPLRDAGAEVLRTRTAA